MITDARVLRTGFVPREVVHRDAEVTHLTEILVPLTDGNPAETTLLVGPSGVGKTCLAKYTAEQLRQEVLDVEYQYVNCWQNFSEFRTLYSILEGLGKNVDIHRQSTPRDELYDLPVLDPADLSSQQVQTLATKFEELCQTARNTDGDPAAVISDIDAYLQRLPTMPSNMEQGYGEAVSPDTD